MPRVLIISPYFPPSNSADMQRIRMSLPYYKEFGWDAEVMCVSETYTDISTDDLLMKSIPSEVIIHRIPALDKRWTSKFGLGSIALRSLLYYRTYVNSLLTKKKFDLIFFSTTQYPVCILGPYWKKKFNVPYIIDFQDPWFSNYYQDKPKERRPRKYWFSYHLDKFLEPIALRESIGIISVSQTYIDDLKNRYDFIGEIKFAVITFGGSKSDIEIVINNGKNLELLFDNREDYKHIVYVGRGGYDMQLSVKIFLEEFKNLLLEDRNKFKQLRFHFIGTSYAPNGKGIKIFMELAETLELEEFVFEQTDRISFYDSLYNLRNAHALFIPGSDENGYTASKVFPYILCEKPTLAIFNKTSSAAKILKECNAGVVCDIEDIPSSKKNVNIFLKQVVESSFKNTNVNWKIFKKHEASAKAEEQCTFFTKCLNKD